MDPEEKRLKLESDILDIIQTKLSSGQMSAERARDIARMVVEKLHPLLTLEQLFEIAPTLDDEFAELTAAILPILQEHDDKIRLVVSDHAEQLIKSGKIEEATNMLKTATS